MSEPESEGGSAELIAGDYQVRRRIASGGQADVFEAWDRRFLRRVAVKILRPGSLIPEFERRFQREAKQIQRIGDPHIIQVFADGRHDARPFIVMEFADGGSLKDRMLRDPGPMPLRAALLTTAALAEALGKAHRGGIVHRDVKPDNILWVGAIAKVGDFGLAKDPQDTLTLSGCPLGTPNYAAPEQWTDARRAGPEADVFSLALTLMYMLRGAHVLPRGRTTQEYPLAPACELCPGIPRALAAVLDDCLQRDRHLRRERTPDGQVLALRLRTIAEDLDHEPVTAPRVVPPSVPEPAPQVSTLTVVPEPTREPTAPPPPVPADPTSRRAQRELLERLGKGPVRHDGMIVLAASAERLAFDSVPELEHPLLRRAHLRFARWDPPTLELCLPEAWVTSRGRAMAPDKPWLLPAAMHDPLEIGGRVKARQRLVLRVLPPRPFPVPGAPQALLAAGTSVTLSIGRAPADAAAVSLTFILPTAENST